MMKRPEFLETKRTPRYSLRKLNVGVASVLLGVTIFGINFTDHSVKAATIESVKTSNSSSNSNSQQPSTVVLPERTNTQKATSASNNTTANNSKEAATTPQSSPETQGSAGTDINSSAARSAAKNLLAMNLMKASGTDTGTDTGTDKDRSAAVTVNPDNINTQPAKENQKLANEHNLSSSDNYSSNIYKGTDGKYYKIVTIYGNDYVYRAADIQASGANWRGLPKQTAEDIKNNINISKEDLGNGKTRWTVVFFPNKGLQNYHGTLHGLSNAKFGIALTSDYQIVGNVDMDVISDPKQSFVSHTFKDNSNSATNIPVQNPSPEVKFSFNPKTDVDENTGLINSKTMPAYNNKYLQGPYYFTTATSAGTNNLWQTYFKDADERKNAYDYTTPYLGGNHDFHVNTFKIANETGVDGAKYGDSIIYDKRGGVNGVFNSVNFNQAMEFKSQGFTGNGQSQFSSYKISFTTQHTDSHEVELTTGSKNQQFSGISANIYSFQQDYYNMMSSLYGEQRALDPAGVVKQANEVVSGWGPAKEAMGQIKQDYLNNAQINVLWNKILNNITDHDAVNNIIKEGNSLNDAMKKLGNSIGQYDSDGSFAGHKEDTTKASDRYKYANPDKKAAYDKATEVTKALINKDTGDYADQATVEKLTTDENNAWSALDGVKPDAEKITPKVPKTKEPVADTSNLTKDEQDKVQKKVEEANKGNFPEGTTVKVGADGTATVTYPDTTTDTIEGSKLVRPATDADNYNPKGDEITVNRNTKLGPTEAKGAIKNAQSLPNGTTFSWDSKKLPDTSTPGQKNGWVVVTYPDTSRDIVPVKINVKTDAESYTVTPKDKVSVDKGEDVDPASLVTVTDPDGKQVQLPAGSIDWKDGAKPDLTTQGDKTGSVEVTFLDGSKKDTDVTIHVKTDAETYDPQAQPWTTTVGKTPKADEVISSTDKNGKKMPSDANYTWKTKPNTSKTGEASGEVKVTYSDGSQDEVHVTINVKDKLDDNEKYHIYGKDGLKVDKGQTLDPKDAIDVKDADGKETTLPEKSKVEWTKDKEPDFSQAGKDVTGEVTVTYPDHTQSDSVPVTVHVTGESDKYKVAPRDGVTVQRGGQVDPEKTVVAQTPDGKPTSFPDETTHKWVTAPDTSTTGNRTGVVETTFPDGSTTTTTVSVNVEPNQSDKITPNVPSTKEPVANTSSLTKDEKDKVKTNVTDANKDKFPDGTTVDVGDDGTATVTYPDGSKDTIPGSDLVRQSKDADKITPNVPSTKEPVANTSSLTKDEKDKVKTNVTDANKDKFPDGTTVDVGDDGTATVTYPDGSKDTIPGSDLVRQSKDADKITPNVPSTKEPVANTSSLTKDEKDKVKTNVTDANKDKFPDGTTVDVGDDGTATVTYPDGSKDTIPGSDLVRQSKDADKITPNVPSTKEPVANTSSLTKDEKDKVKTNVTDANKDKFPDGTTVDVGDDGTATVTYPDGSKDTIPGSDLVRQSKDADKITPNVPSTKEPVANTSSLTKDEKDKVKTNVTDANKDKFPDGTTVDVGDDGTATVTYPDGSKDTIPGSDLVRQSKDADKITPNVPSTKEPVANTSSLTKDEKDKVKTNVTDANKDKFPDGTTVDVGDDGTATVTYPDGSKDTIPGSDLVRQSKDADKITPNVPSTKEPVANTSSLTKDEKDKVKTNVTDANKDKFPAGTTVEVGKDGTATVTYPDGSKDTIPGSDLVRQSKDADKITPNVPSTKEPVANTSSLTKDEKDKVKTNVTDANKDKFPDGTTVDVGDDGTATVTYPDGSKDTIPGSDLVRQSKDADKITPNVPSTKEPVANTSSLTKDEKDKVKTNVTDANKDKFPDGTTVDVGDDGTATVTYPDGSKDTIPGSDLVRQSKDADKITPNVPSTKEPVANTSSLTKDEKDKVKTNVTDANKDKFPDGTTVDVGDDGTATVTYPDGSKDTIPGSDLVRQSKDADKITPNVPSTKEPVANTSSLTKDEKDKVKTNVTDANKDKFPAGTTVEVGKDGTATVTYPDGSKDTIPGSDLVRQSKDADKITPNVPSTKEPVANTSSLTKDEKDKVKTNVTDANKDKFPDGTTVDVGDDGTATVTYPDGSKDTIPGSDLVRQSKDADKITPNVPSTKEPVANTSSLTKDEKDKVKTNVTDANKDKFPDGTTVDVGDDGTATVTYPDGSKDTIPGSDLVRQSKDADKITPNVPSTKEPVANTSSLTKDEKDKVKTNVTDANKDKFPDGTTVDVGDDGTATVTYPDGSKDTIPGSDLVRQSKDADKITPNVPSTKEPVANTSSLTKDEKDKVKTNVTDANKDKFPAGTTVEVGKDGTATVTYPDGSKDTIPGDQLVQGQKGSTTDAGNITPTVPGDKVTVKDPSHLTDDEKKQVQNNVDNANKDKFPAGTTVEVGKDGTATVTYPDGSKDTIPGDQLVQGQKGSTTDAGNITPTVPGDKVTVKDPSHLTDDEKKQVQNNVDNANKDKFPAGTTVEVGKDGTATVTYPDGSKDTIPGDQLVQGQKGSTTDAGNITPTVPGGKVTVKDPSHLTDDEKKQVQNNVDNANKDKFPAGTKVTVGDDGTATVTYPDGSKDTIPGDQLVQGQKGGTTDAGNITPTVPGGKVTVKDPSHLTDDEKKQVQNNVDNANKDKFPAGTTVEVGKDGTATVTYPDGSKDTIPGDQLVQGQKGSTTDAGNITPNVPGDKVTVKDPSHLTDDEKDQVKTNITNANKDTLPSGSQITVGDDGTATITYPDGSKDTIPGRDLIKGISGNKHDSNSSSGSNGTISNTDDETSGDTVNNAESMNGNTAKSGSKNNSLKTLPQTGTKDVTILEILGLFLSLFGLLGLKKKHHEE
ncbi:LEA family epithelial adhesin [Limosilactobacillus reuteri]|uniref:LEA family epithelial adhesin n=1 Tax=Limosilactobacillus reuteri TaxID=1598 RepID=UPI002361003F|nr:LEA family epithelial adhesin [Limosilactobacillus reuteri]MDD1400221.1 LEA family epithelial adhesin [Limosilactobacillus reuteri]